MDQNSKGIAALLLAYIIWGVMPVFWKALEAISSFELLGHRVIWSAVFSFILMFAHKNWELLRETIKERKSELFLLAGGGLLISLNWGIYIWAVNNGRILEACLGIFISPLLSVFFGMLVFKEKLKKIQLLSLVLVLVGVSVELVAVGSIPLVSIGLAISFGLYSVLKKAVHIKPDIALFVETLTVAPIALISLIFLQQKGIASYPYGTMTNLLLAGTGIITSVPLILFAYGVSRVSLTTTGLIQYITPTIGFIIGLFIYKELIPLFRVFTFIFIWTALIMYTFDSILTNIRKHKDAIT